MGSVKTFSGEFFWLREELRGGGYVGRTFHGEIFNWEDNFREGVQDYLAFLQNNEKINMKNVFQLKVRSSIET